jgi:hypothetical protein
MAEVICQRHEFVDSGRPIGSALSKSGRR